MVWRERAGTPGTGVQHVFLYESQDTDKESVNEHLVNAGHVRVSESQVRESRRVLNTTHSHGGGVAGQDKSIGASVGTELLARLREAEKSAHSKHVGMWAYGDPGGSDDDERSSRP